MIASDGSASRSVFVPETISQAAAPATTPAILIQMLTTKKQLVVL
jgi:hypothetical protein